MNVSRRIRAVVALSFLMSRLAPGDMVPTQATQAFLDADAARRVCADGGGVTALYGTVLDSDNDPATDTDACVAAFLTNNADALGVDGVVLEQTNKINIRNDKFTVYTYVQKIEGLPVHGTVVKVPVLLGATERIPYVGGRVIDPPPAALPADVLSAVAAVGVVSQSAEWGYLTTYSAGEKMIYKAGDDTLHRVWRFSGSDDDESWAFFVDTASGEVVGVVDLVLRVDVQGTITGFATPGTKADDPSATYPETAPVEMLMGGVQVSLTTDTQVLTRFTEPDGTYIFEGETSGTLESRLIGEWVTVVNKAGNPFDDLSGGGTEGNPDLVFNDDDAPPDAFLRQFDTAQVNVFLVIEKTHDWFAGLQPTFGGIDRNMRAIMAFPIGSSLKFSCNAAYYGETNPPRTVFFTDGLYELPNSNLSAHSTIISHEYGHFILDQLLPGGLVPFEFSEGVADVVFSLLWDTDCLGEGWFRDDPSLGFVDIGLVPCARNMAGAPNGFERFVGCPPAGCKVQLGDPDCGGAKHCLGLALAQSFWELREAIGLQETAELFADFLFITDGKLDESVLIEVLVADDDDGDLNTPSTNQAAIETAFVFTHGWSEPDCTNVGQVNVEWDGPPGRRAARNRTWTISSTTKFARPT